jgi:hypothetical protein
LAARSRKSRRCNKSYDAANFINSAVVAVKGDLTKKDAMRTEMRKANYASVRGPYKYGNNHFPIQNFYLQDVVKDAEGQPDAQDRRHHRQGQPGQAPPEVSDEVVSRAPDFIRAANKAALMPLPDLTGRVPSGAPSSSKPSAAVSPAQFAVVLFGLVPRPRAPTFFAEAAWSCARRRTATSRRF